MNRAKNLSVIGLPALVILGLGLALFLRPAAAYSLAERRLLAQAPAPSTQTILSGRYMEDLEAAALDQFPLREGFRSLKAYAWRDLFRHTDHHGLYTAQGHLAQADYPLREAALEKSLAQLRQIDEQYLVGTGCRLFLAPVPDKGYYLAPAVGVPTLDYGRMVAACREALSRARYIDLFSVLSPEDYYRTDPHWRQEALRPAAAALAAGMGAEIAAEYTEVTLEAPFYGAYVGQSALRATPDVLRCLTSPLLENCTVTSYDTGEARRIPLYDTAKATGRDPYEMFLGGSDALVTLENPLGPDRELVIFRDSFAGPLAPLLAPGYRKITLVDLRYIRPELLPRFITFTDQDVLFLYSTAILNRT